MTIQEEIEELKRKLAEVKDELEEGEVLIALLEKCVRISDTSCRAYVEQLYQIAKKFNDTVCLAYAKVYESKLNLHTDYFDSTAKLQEALALFQSIHYQKGIADTYSSLGLAYEHQGNLNEALKNHLAALKALESENDKQGVAKCYSNIGIVYDKQGNYPEAIKYYKTALEINKETGYKKGIGNCYNNIGVVFSLQGNYPDALTSYFNALKITEEIGDKREIGYCYNNIGNVFHKQSNHPEALKNFLTALKLYEEANYTRGIGACYCNLANIYDEQADYPKALNGYLTALKLFEESGDKSSIGNCYNNIGNIYQRQGNYTEALENYRTGLKTIESIGDKRGVGVCLVNLGAIYLKQNAHDKAIEMLGKAEAILNEVGDKNAIKETYIGLSATYKSAGNYKDALNYYELYDRIKTEILGLESQKQINNLRFTHDLETKEKQLEIEHLRNVELKRERDRSEALLLNILPSEVAEELKEKGEAEAKLFDEVTVLFTDFKSFTTVSEKLTPQELVGELNECFKAFDEIIGKYNIEKIKTVGDAYLAAAGLPSPNQSHADDMIKAALEIRDFMVSRRKELGNRTFEMRVGIHSGSVVAGIVGVKKFAYDIWGDTVNTAARMEQNGVPGKVNISHTTYELVKDKFKCEYRGEIDAKNKGKLKMYFVE